MSPFLTGPLTFLTKLLEGLFTKTTFTCVIPPLDPIVQLFNEGGVWSCERPQSLEGGHELTSLADDLLNGCVCDFSLVIHVDSFRA
jgi:hypothetical protein